MTEIIKSACLLNCFDSCGLLVYREGNRLVDIKGDPDHPLTKGVICAKGRKLLERVYHPERILHPMQKNAGAWRKISWEKALDIIAERLNEIRERYGTTAVFHYYFSGSNGILRKLDQRFFNAFGGVTRPVGSLCWGSGVAAQKYDFGALQMHEWADCLNAKAIILWGRNPETTNIHFVPYIKKAVANGSKLVVINPVQMPIGRSAELCVSIRPGTDGALALGLANILMDENTLDMNFIAKHTFGFADYAKLIADYPPARVSAITGVSEKILRQLAHLYGKNKPACIIFGHGLQRYSNGGQTVRAIDALAALTGNIGIPGGGANFGHGNWDFLTDRMAGDELAKVTREFPYPMMAQSILEASDPPVKFLFVTRSNPVCQNPNSGRVKEAFQRIDFKVVIDFFMTDTAEMADLFLPCTTQFEEEDIVVCSSNNYMGYAPKMIEPLGEARPEPEIFTSLARRMKISGFENKSSRQWLEYALQPVKHLGISLEALQEGALRNPAAPEVPWSDYSFSTSTGKYEFYSEKAKCDGLDPLPVFRELQESTAHPLHFLTPHHKSWIHSQFSHFDEKEKGTAYPTLELHPLAAKDRGIDTDDIVSVESPRGKITAAARLNPNLRPDVVQMFEGSWLKDGGGVNLLTADSIADMGKGTPYFDCLCQVRKKTEE